MSAMETIPAAPVRRRPRRAVVALTEAAAERVKSISYATNEDGTFVVKVRGLDGKDVWASESATPARAES